MMPYHVIGGLKSDNKWKTDQIKLQWLQKLFNTAINSHTVGKYCLLISEFLNNFIKNIN